MPNLVKAVKGQVVDLTKTSPGQVIFKVGVGWVEKTDSSVKDDFDIDVVAILSNLDGTGATETDLYFYNNIDGKGTVGDDFYAGLAKDAIFQKAEQLAATNMIAITKDNRDGVGAGDDETLFVNVGLIPDGKKITIACNIYEAESRKQVFGMINNAYINVYDPTGTVLITYDMEDYSIETGVLVAEFYSKTGSDKFKAIGVGFNGDLNDLIVKFA